MDKAPHSRPIFIMSSERSGSNLLRRLLSNHSRISGPVAPHFLKTISANEAGYLSQGGGIQKMFEDTRLVANHRKHQWNIETAFTEFESRYRPESFMDIFDGFYGLVQERDAAEFVICKENNIFDYAEMLFDYYRESCMFVYLHRDPRDYAWSWMQVPFMHQTPAAAAHWWVEEQSKCQAVERRLPGAVVSVGYEEILEDVRLSIDRVLARVGLTAEPGCYDPTYEKASSEDTEFVFFKNLDKPIQKGNRGKSKSGFDDDALYQIEDIALPYMKSLGYRPHYAHSALKTLYWRLRRKLAGANPTRFKKTEHDEYSYQLVRDWQELQISMQTKFD